MSTIIVYMFLLQVVELLLSLSNVVMYISLIQFTFICTRIKTFFE